jgi:hypothetical protein
MSVPIEETRPGYVWTGDKWVLFSGPPGIPGVTPHFGLPLMTTTDLPAVGEEGEMRYIEDNGDVWGWDMTDGKWSIIGQWRGQRGKAGPAGETLKVNGVVKDKASLPVGAPELAVYVTQDDVHMYVKDTASAVADAQGWVDMGRVQGPPGPAALLTGSIRTRADLPAVGDPGQMILVDEDGHLYGWDEIDQRWNDGGWIRRPSALITDWKPISYMENAVVIHDDKMWLSTKPAHDTDIPGQAAGSTVTLTVTTANKAGDLGHEGQVPPSGFQNIETYDFKGSTVPVGGFMRFGVMAPATVPYTPAIGAFAGVAFPDAISWIVNTGDPTIGHDGWVVVNGTDTAGETTATVSVQRGQVWELAAVTKLDDLTDVKATTPANGDTLTFNGTEWVNSPAASGVPVGTIIQSLFTEAQFKSTMSPDEAAKWVVADGRSIAGSDYAKVTGQNTVFDMRGGFLRAAGDNVNGTWKGGALGSWHDDTTRMPRNPMTAASAGGHKHLSGQPGYTPYGSQYGFGPGTSKTGLGGAGNDNRAYVYSSTEGAHTHTVSGGGDPETMPKHFSVNFFVKINA